MPQRCWRMLLRDMRNLCVGVLLLMFTAQLPAKPNGECVILLHGILANKHYMRPMAQYLQKHGYMTVNISYPSTKRELRELIAYVKRDIDAIKTEPCTKLHFVGWSMGSFIIRGLLHQHSWDNLGRVVFLGPPSQGSELADALDNIPLYHHIFGPAGKQLRTNQEAIEKVIGTQADYPLGIIAGNLRLNPIASMILPGEHDGRVSVERTKLKGMDDHITLRVDHSFLPSNKTAKHQTRHFLEHGAFR